MSLAAKYKNYTDLWLEVKNSISHAVELNRYVDHVGICGKSYVSIKNLSFHQIK